MVLSQSLVLAMEKGSPPSVRWSADTLENPQPEPPNPVGGTGPTSGSMLRRMTAEEAERARARVEGRRGSVNDVESLLKDKSRGSRRNSAILPRRGSIIESPASSPVEGRKSSVSQSPVSSPVAPRKSSLGGRKGSLVESPAPPRKGSLSSLLGIRPKGPSLPDFIKSCPNEGLKSYLTAAWNQLKERGEGSRWGSGDSLLVKDTFWIVKESSHYREHPPEDWSVYAPLDFFQHFLPQCNLPEAQSEKARDEILQLKNFLDESSQASLEKNRASVKEKLEVMSAFGSIQRHASFFKKLFGEDHKDTNLLKGVETSGRGNFLGLLRKTPHLADVRLMHHPIRNQGETKVCYSYAAADFISFRLEQLQRANKVSPCSVVRACLAYKARFIDVITSLNGKVLDPLKGGEMHKAVACAVQEGVCSDEAFAKAVLALQRKPDQPSRKKSNASDCQEFLQRGLQPSHGLQELSNAATEVAERFQNDTAGMLLAIMEMCPREEKINLSPEDFETIAFSTKDPKDKKKALEEINRQLNAGQVVGVSIEAFMLQHGPFDEPPKKDEEQHAVLIVGTRINKTNGQDYLVRNSWGEKSCESYFYECEQGNIWIPAADLALNLTSVTHFKKVIEAPLPKQEPSVIEAGHDNSPGSPKSPRSPRMQDPRPKDNGGEI